MPSVRKVWDAFWTQLLKVVRKQSSISREVKTRKEHKPEDSVEIVLQLLRAGSTVCVCHVEGHWRTQAQLLWGCSHGTCPTFRALSWMARACHCSGAISYSSSPFGKNPRTGSIICPQEAPIVACGERTEFCWVAQETSKEIRKEASMSSLSGHLSTASHGNVNSAALSPHPQAGWASSDCAALQLLLSLD